MKELKHISRIHKKLTEGLSSSELDEHKGWLKEDSDHLDFESEIGFAWEQSEKFEPKFDFNASSAFNKFKLDKDSIDAKVVDNTSAKQAKVISFIPRKWVYGMTACVVVGLMSMFVFNSPAPSAQYFASANEKLEVSLEDRSKIVLAEGSSLDVASDFGSNTRTTTLKGKAYFDIERNEQKPFIINTENGSIEVLGTAFNLSSVGSKVVLEVEEGLVAFTNGDKRELFKAGEKLVFDNNKIARSSIESSAAFNWKNGNLRFIKSSLPKVFEELSDYFNVQFEFSNVTIEANAATCPPITITNIKNPELNVILDLLKDTSGLEYRMVDDNKKVRIIGLSCS